MPTGCPLLISEVRSASSGPAEVTVPSGQHTAGKLASSPRPGCLRRDSKAYPLVAGCLGRVKASEPQLLYPKMKIILPTPRVNVNVNGDKICETLH